MNIAHPNAHWKRLFSTEAFPGWAVLGWKLLSAISTLSTGVSIGEWLKSHFANLWSFLTSPIGNFSLIVSGLLWLAGVVLWPRSADSSSSLDSSPQQREQSTKVSLQAIGKQPLERNSDWRLLATNCTSRFLYKVKLGTIRSEIGRYEMSFREINLLTGDGGQELVMFEVSSRRIDDISNKRKFTLWDFALDHAGERGSRFIWYDIPVFYREQDDGKVRDGGLVAICFDLQEKIIKTEDAEYWRKHNYNAMFAESERKLSELERNTKKLRDGW